jgi:hypothetical protein
VRLLTSQLSSPAPAPLVVSRGTSLQDAQREAQKPVLWPRYDPVAKTTRLVPIRPDRIPMGWQSVQFHVPMRLATCEETDCPFFLGGWTEVLVADGNQQTRPGAVSQEQAAAEFGLFGPREIAPNVIHHPAGTPCPRIHKVPSGVPPLYTVNGRPVLWNEFEDSLGNGIHQAASITGR